jgi:hypothetical protein
MIRSLWCRIGLHRWRNDFMETRPPVLRKIGGRYLGLSSIVSNGRVCTRCGKRRSV